MLQSDVADALYHQQLWKSKVFFPNTDRTEDGQKGQIASLLSKVTQKIQGWDKDKRTGLLHKTAACIANGAGADSDRVNKQMGWKGDTQSRSYALADLGAYLDVQAMLGGFDKDSWRQNHHLGRSAVAVDEAWYDVLLPGLSAKLPELSPRRQEVLHTMQELAEAYWQALPVNLLKHGENVVAGLPKVVKIMQTTEYARFSAGVLQAECDSMEKLQMMQEVPYLAEWQQANTARAESQQVAHHASTSTSTELSEAREQSHVRSAEATGIVSQEPPAKRQKIAFNAADMEQQMQAELEQVRSQKRCKELQVQIDREKLETLELDQQQREILKRRQMMSSSAQSNCAFTEQAMSASTSKQHVQPSNTLIVPELQNQAVLAGSSAAENSIELAAQLRR